MVSALSRNSSVSVLKSILLWILIVLVIPNLGPYVSSELFPIPSLVRITKEYNQLSGEEGAKRAKEVHELIAELDKRYEEKYGELFKEYIAIPREKRLERTGMESPDSDIKTMGLKYRQEYRAIGEKIDAPIIERREKVREQIKIEAERQTRVSKNIAAISPFADYIYLSADLAGTGMRSKENIERATSEFGALADKFSQEKSDEKDRKRISDWKNIKDNPLDISGRPRFSYEEEPLPARISVSLPYLGVMLLYGVLFFAIAFVGFIRYDVR
jgi:ABC-type transport system involved in multi-copper enzyme maturation permease subunit